MTWIAACLLAAVAQAREVAIPPTTETRPEPLTLGVVEIVWRDGPGASRSADVERVVSDRAPVRFVAAGRVEVAETWGELEALPNGSIEEIRWIESVAARAEGAPCDAYAILYEGRMGRVDRMPWPHAGIVPRRGGALKFLVAPADDGTGWTAGVLLHEIGHLFGLREHRAGVDRTTCPMAGAYEPGDAAAIAPPGYCAPCRARMGWLVPTPVSDRLPVRLRIDGTPAAAQVRTSLAATVLVEVGDETRVWSIRGTEVSYVGVLSEEGALEAPGASVQRVEGDVEVRVPPSRGRILGASPAERERRGVVIGERR